MSDMNISFGLRKKVFGRKQSEMFIDGREKSFQYKMLA